MPLSYQFYPGVVLGISISFFLIIFRYLDKPESKDFFNMNMMSEFNVKVGFTTKSVSTANTKVPIRVSRVFNHILPK